VRFWLWKKSRGLTVALIIILFLVTGGAVWLGFIIWPRIDKPSVEFSAHLPKAAGPYPPNTTIGGTSFSSGMSDLRVNVNNGSVPIHDLDFDVSTDASIKAVSQVSDLPNVSFQPVPWIGDEDRKNGYLWQQGTLLQGEDSNGNPVTQPIDSYKNGQMIAPIYHVHCANLYANTPLYLVVATLRLGPNQNPSIPRPPKYIRLKGNYDTSGPDGTKRYHFDKRILLGD